MASAFIKFNYVLNPNTLNIAFFKISVQILITIREHQAQKDYRCVIVARTLSGFISKNLYTLGLSNAIDLPYIRILLQFLHKFPLMEISLF
ncbi:hypothetical protein BpHYR1_030204 [Brachionus plicatilis]|uniref:Uncharacterized protein n=1 Tax=Brachionus plicatilis TaxID=10195 RepID=A0A3M7RMR4_BRAPC|nr:hypothetical protein BpHYR1_030204 [Brachionus plicatilis]